MLTESNTSIYELLKKIEQFPTISELQNLVDLEYNIL